MNHNFLPYEVTLLLPKNNPYQIIYQWCQSKSGIENDVFMLSPVSVFKSLETPLRDCWTILDALQWLEDEHKITIELTVSKNIYGKFLYWNDIRSIEDDTMLNTSAQWYETRVEAYTQGIKDILRNYIIK